jgi:hypothetical protein
MYPFVYDLEHECIIYIMYDQGVIIRYVNPTHSCKLCVKNENFGIIDQCMQTLKKDFYLGILSS